MAYKKIEDNFSFADIAINKNADRNRSLLFLRKVNNTIDWDPVEKLLMEHYHNRQIQRRRKSLFSNAFV